MILTNRHLADVCDRLQVLLAAAAKERGQRSNVVDTPDGPAMEWELHERTVLLEEVNRIRADQGWQPVRVADVARADRAHAGHCDWFEKFTWDCARIAVYDGLRRA